MSGDRYTNLNNRWLYDELKPEKDCDHLWEALGGTVKPRGDGSKFWQEDETLIRCTKCHGYKVAKDGVY